MIACADDRLLEFLPVPLFKRLFLALALFAATPAFAETAFEKAVHDAYVPYRSAESYLRTGNVGLASLDLAAAVDAWRAVEGRFADNPPDAYGNDAAFAADLAVIGKMLETGLTLADEAKGGEAETAIEPVRARLYDLRRRNGVETYADCITDLNRVMDRLYVHRRPAPDLGNAAIADQIEILGKDYAAQVVDCRALASGSIRNDAEFKRLFDGAEMSSQSLMPALEAGDPVAVVNVIRELRSLDRIIYFRFGG